jgi:hypothetical protein
MDYGTDFLLVDDDIVFTPDGDVLLTSGPHTIAQDIDQELKICVGRLVWAPEDGSSMPLFLNDSQVNDAAVLAELKRVAIKDARVDPISVKAYKRSNGKFRLEFVPLGSVNPETLDFDLGEANE